MKRTFALLIMIITMTTPAFAQEFITGLPDNPVVREESERISSLGQVTGRESLDTPSLVLPFFDDFKRPTIFPSDNRWLDREAYVNTNYSFRPANLGAVTLDAIDSKGKLHQNASTFPFLADSLTSRPIRLDSIFDPVARAISIADSIYFSFFYQPQGTANPPEPTDSLVLEFRYATGDTVFANYYDSIAVPLNFYINPGDTIYPGDTLYSPEVECQPGLYHIATRIYTYDDVINLPCDSVFEPEFAWQWVWSSPGMPLDTFYNRYGVHFLQVMIPVTDSLRFFRDGFQFRFYNLASLASDNNPSWRGNCDQWNLDYILLDIGRSAGDTIHHEIAFVEPAPSLLKDYQAMPYRQFLDDPTNELKESMEIFISNLDSASYNMNYTYTVDEYDGSFHYLYYGGGCILDPFYENDWQDCNTCPQHACPPLDFVLFTDPKDSAEFLVRHYIIENIIPPVTLADTISFRQKFFNYYAYDDGTPEAGYGLTPTGARLAYRFNLNQADTLRAVQMYFNRTVNDANEQFFNLVVWRDNSGQPGEPVYVEENLRVNFTNSLSSFYTYMLKEPVPVNGIFYVGWEQLSDNNLNLGFDRNNNARQNIFYNTGNGWFTSSNNGALMMRPHIGKPFELSGVPEGKPSSPVIGIYPNPLSGRTLYFRMTEPSFLNSRYYVRIYDIMGSLILETKLSQAIEVPDCAPGIYLVVISSPDGRAGSTFKLVKKP